VLSYFPLKAQLVVQDVLTDVELVEQVLLGDGVQVYNISSTGAGQAIGQFDTGVGDPTIPMSGGIIMSTGNVFNAPGPNGSGGTSTANGTSGDTDIETIIGINTNDAAIIEFDFKSPADTVRFNYIFASEEYREFVCDFNDAFAFLLTGPDPLGGNYTNHNIALVPGTSTEVAIATVNNGDTNSTCTEENSNSGYFVDNTGGFFVEYDGLTDMFTAVAVVVPCQEYHIKLVIADASDSAFDSAVFLEANSFGAAVDTLIADFVFDAPSCIDEPVDFVNAGPTGSGITYEWTFGGASASQASSILENPSVSWSTPGLYQVDLKIIINCGMDSSMVTKYVNIHERPDADFTFINDVCEGNSVQFTNTGSTGSEYTHEWVFTTDAEPSVSYAENPVVIFNESGMHTVQHIVRNDHCTRVYEDVVNITIGPEASFTHTGPACLNQELQFTNTGTSAGVTFDWSFGPDGIPATSTDENPSGILFASSGTKTVILTLTDSGTGCQNTYETDIQILDVPVADFSFTNLVCVGASVDFTNTGSTGGEYTYLWDFGPNASQNSSAAENPQDIDFDVVGTQDITLTVSNSVCSSIIMQSIDVNTSPAPVVSFTSTAPKCDNESVDFSFDQDPTNLDFSWDFGVNANPLLSSDENPVDVGFSTYGVQVITLTVTDQISGCTNSETQSINLYETPIADFTFTDSVCAGALVDFTNTGSSGQGFVYSWDFGASADPTTSGAENPTGISYDSDGNKVITLTVSTPQCVATTTDTLVIKNSPAPVLDFSSTSPVCEENNIVFNISDYDASLSYLWTFGPDATPNTSTDQEPLATFSNDGIYSVNLYVNDPTTGCNNYVGKTIQVYPRPDVSFTSDAPVCIGESVSFTNTGSSGAEFSYSWDFGEGASPSVSNAENPLAVTYSSSGSKVVTLTIASTSCTRTISQTIEISSSPVVDFTTDAPQCADQEIQMHNLSLVEGAATYDWSFGPEASISSSNDFEPIITYSETGTYEIQLIVTNDATGCMDSISTFINVYATPDVSFTSNAPLCPNESLSFTNEGSTGSEYSYSWNFGRYGHPYSSTAENPTGISFSQGGTQDITFTISNNDCSLSIYETIDLHDMPTADAGPDTIICANRSVIIGTPEIDSYDYFWLPEQFVDDNTLAEPIASPLAEFTSYFVTVVDVNTGCTNIDSVNITMLPPAVANAGYDIDVCVNEIVQLGTGEIPGQAYLWYPSIELSDTTISNPMATPVESIIYTLNVSYAGCDTVSDQVAVTVHQLPAIDAGEDQTITVGEQTNLYATGGVNYIWSPALFINNPYLSNPLVYPDDTITYVVVGTDVFGCESIDSVEIFVKEPQFYIPNSFTPNDDGRNDVFYIRGNPLENYQLQIFNRLNQSIFIIKNYYDGWDGTMQNSGKDCPEGAYVYIVTGITEDGESVTESGMVNLIR